MRTLAVIGILCLSDISHAACTVDSDCPPGEECKESKSGTFKCYRIEKDPPKKDNGSKKKKRVCDSSVCGWSSCWTGLISIPCAACCYVEEK